MWAWLRKGVVVSDTLSSITSQQQGGLCLSTAGSNLQSGDIKIKKGWSFFASQSMLTSVPRKHWTARAALSCKMPCLRNADFGFGVFSREENREWGKSWVWHWLQTVVNVFFPHSAVLAACKRSASWVLAEVFLGQPQDWHYRNTCSQMCVHSCGVSAWHSSSLFLRKVECISLPELSLVSLWTWENTITHKVNHGSTCLPSTVLLKWCTYLVIIHWISRRNVLSCCGKVRRRQRSLRECFLTADG